MKTPIVIVLFASLTLTVSAGPKEDWLQKQRVERAAKEMFRSGSAASAVAHLRQNLRAEAGPGGDAVALAQYLVDIAVSFYNSREMQLARAATAQAVIAGDQVLNGNGANQIPGARRADLCGSLGMLEESVRFDLAAAQRYYDAAAGLAPNDKLHKIRRQLAAEKAKRRAGGQR